jgi:hypothetical protein
VGLSFDDSMADDHHWLSIEEKVLRRIRSIGVKMKKTMRRNLRRMEMETRMR